MPLCRLDNNGVPMRIFIVILLSVFAISCQSTQSTQSTNPTYIFESSKLMTKEALVAAFVSKGYQINRDSDFLLVVERPIQKLAGQILFGSKFNSKPNARVHLTFVGQNPTKVIATMQVITNPNSGFEKSTDVTRNPKVLESVEMNINAAKALLASST